MPNPKDSVPIVIKKELKEKLDIERISTGESYNDIIGRKLDECQINKLSIKLTDAEKEKYINMVWNDGVKLGKYKTYTDMSKRTGISSSIISKIIKKTAIGDTNERQNRSN